VKRNEGNCSYETQSIQHTGTGRPFPQNYTTSQKTALRNVAMVPAEIFTIIFAARFVSDFVVLFSRGEAATDLRCGRCYM